MGFPHPKCRLQGQIRSLPQTGGFTPYLIIYTRTRKKASKIPRISRRASAKGRPNPERALTPEKRTASAVAQDALLRIPRQAGSHRGAPFQRRFPVTTPCVPHLFSYFSNFKENSQTDVCFFCFLCYTKHNIELLCERKEALHEETDTYAPEDSGVRIRVHP